MMVTRKELDKERDQRTAPVSRALGRSAKNQIQAVDDNAAQKVLAGDEHARAGRGRFRGLSNVAPNLSLHCPRNHFHLHEPLGLAIVQPAVHVC